MTDLVRIERVPKLDKVLRVTFIAVKKDVQELKEEFNLLEEKVESSLAIYRERVDTINNSLSKDINTKTAVLEKHMQHNYEEIDAAITDLAKTVEQFIKHTSAKMGTWSKTINRVEATISKTNDLAQDVQEVILLKSELKRIKAIEEQLTNIESLTVLKKHHKQDLDAAHREMQKMYDKLLLDLTSTTSNIEQSLTDVQKQIEKQNVVQQKDVLTRLDAQEKQLQKTQELTQKDLDKRFETLEGAHKKELAGLQKNIQTLEEQLTKKENAKQQQVEDHAILIKAFQKQFEEFKKSLKDQEKAHKDDIAALKKEHTDLLKTQEKNMQKELSVLQKQTLKSQAKLVPEKPVTKAVVEKVPVEKKKTKKSIFNRFVDFLIEDVPPENDAKLQEFEKKKGEKFEIKEINLKE